LIVSSASLDCGRDDPEHFEAEYLKISRPYLNPVSGTALKAREEMRKQVDERLRILEERISALLSERAS
jgi:hypothetical protein